MILARLALAYIVLFGFAFFFALNVQETVGGSGYIYLGTSLAAFVLLVMASSDLTFVLRMNYSILPLLLFLAYFYAKLHIDGVNSFRIRELTFGTTGGVFYGLIVGFACSYAMTVIYKLRFHRLAHKPAYFAALIYCFTVVVLGISTLQEHLGSVRTDVFLVGEEESHYQRAGDFLYMQMIIVTALAIVVLITSKNWSLKRSLPFLFIVLGLGFTYGLTAQVIGSNSGLATNAAMVVVFITFFFLFSKRISFDESLRTQLRRFVQSAAVSSYLGNISARALLTKGLVAASLVFVLGYGVIQAFGINVSEMRITGFGTGEISSVETRARIFQNNFLSHFAYSPVFGNFQVDRLMGDRGQYVHSLVSILPHLGIVGFTIFMAFIFLLYREIGSPPSRIKSKNLHSDHAYCLYKLVTIFAVLVFGTLTAFLTWLPLWFSFGFLATNWRER